MRNLQLLVTAVQSGLWYTLLVIVLALMSLVFLVYEWVPGANEDIILLGDEIDLYVAYVFLLDFLLGLGFNTSYRNTRHYWRENWLNVLSSVPVTSEFTQALRVLRLLKAARVLRVFVNVWTAKEQLKHNHSARVTRRQ